MLAAIVLMSPAFCVRSSVLVLASVTSAWLVAGCGGSSPPSTAADRDGTELQSASPAGDRRGAPRAELSAREVVLELRGNETDIRRCFLANPKAHGTLSLSWNVNTEGRIERLQRQRSTLSDPRIEQCLSEKLHALRFDPRAEPGRAHWTFVFRLVDSARDAPGKKRKQSNKRVRRQARGSERGAELEKDSPGTLDLSVVDNVVESGYPLFARCYRDGVQRNAGLDGAVRLRFVVGEEGHVTQVEDRGSDLTDRQVVDCVAEGFYALRFPEPQRGAAHLVYRILFESG